LNITSEWQILNRIRVKECGKARSVKTSVCSKECCIVLVKGMSCCRPRRFWLCARIPGFDVVSLFTAIPVEKA